MDFRNCDASILVQTSSEPYYKPCRGWLVNHPFPPG
jgi:hypothetical protein